MVKKSKISQLSSFYVQTNVENLKIKSFFDLLLFFFDVSPKILLGIIIAHKTGWNLYILKVTTDI